ncbi:MAG: phosphoglucosamine mutase [Candidatus Aminicenantales bacterium]
MQKLFGTDGIRAVAGQFPLDYISLFTLGHALIRLLRANGLEPRVIIGRDTRESGAWIEEALVHGIKDSGGTPFSAGIIPTSSISFLTKKHCFAAGIVISASHNPYQDNGIKIFGSEGIKISEEWENKLEKEIFASQRIARKEKIQIRPVPSFLEDYLSFLKGQLSQVPISRKFKIVLDCSNGASSSVAPRVFRELGFEVLALNDSPDGKNINNGCGSLYPQSLAKAVMDAKGDIGIAYDGDADRAVWVDEQGRILNGDHTLFVLSRFMKEKVRLKSRTVVATTMSNMGLELALEKMGLHLQRTRVGDKYVLEKMKQLKANLGGEQSGHTIFLDDCPTGDGILTSLKMMEVLATSHLPLSALVKDFVEFPQVLTTVKVREQKDFHEFPEIIQVIDRVGRSLQGSGRLEVRYSGTETAARVMVEGRDRKQIENCARQIAKAIAKHLGES